MMPQQPPKRSPTAKRERPTGNYTVASKFFIIATLKHILHECETAAKQDGDHQSISYPFEETFLRNCLNLAKTYCIQNIHEESLYGSSKFRPNDHSTYWTEPLHYSCWWKNFIERKAAYEDLVSLARETHGSDKRRQK